MSEVNISLSTICGGALEDQFQDLYPALISQIKQGQKASLSITINFKKIENTDTMLSADYSLTPKFPAVKKASICQITGEGKLKTDAPQPRPQVVNLFNATGGNE